MSIIQDDMGCIFDSSGKIEGILNRLSQEGGSKTLAEKLKFFAKEKESTGNIEDFFNSLYPPEKIITAVEALAQYMSTFPPSCCCDGGVVLSENPFMKNNIPSILAPVYQQG